MEVASKMAGFTLGEADILRRAIGKKKLSILNEQQKLFVRGCLKKGYTEKLAKELYELILKFASYGFNKSHAAAYAMIAYQTAYLKANFPVEFMAAMLTGVMSTSDKVALYIYDCKKMGIKVLPPDINESQTTFTVLGEDRIRFGLAAVKNVGYGAIESIIAARKTGPFLTLRDFCARVDLRTCNKKVLESLIKSGAFDSLGARRSQLLAILDETVAVAQQDQKDKQNGQMCVFDMFGEEEKQEEETLTLKDNLPDIREIPIKEKLLMEKEVLGLYISGHPLEQYAEILKHMPTLMTVLDLAELSDNTEVTVCGMVNSMKTIITKKGKPMGFVTLEDLTGSLEVVVFSEIYERHRPHLEPDSVILIKGTVNSREEEDKKVICRSIIPLPKEPKQLFLRVDRGAELSKLFELKEILCREPGSIPVYLFFPHTRKIMLTEEKFWVSEKEESLMELQSLLGAENVNLKTSAGMSNDALH